VAVVQAGSFAVGEAAAVGERLVDEVPVAHVDDWLVADGCYSSGQDVQAQ
jgi:hypothetical protein